MAARADKVSRVDHDGVTLVEGATSDVRFAFTERAGGVSEDAYSSLNLGSHVGDDLFAVQENRRRALEAMGAAECEHNLLVPNQVHGDHIVAVTSNGADDLEDVREQIAEGCDAIVCTAYNVPVLLCFADCVPVVLVAPGGFAVVHSGWKGTIARISAKACQALCDAAGCDASDVSAYIGPHILGDEYEVSQELMDRFAAEFSCIDANTSRMLDLSAAIREALVDVGVDADNIVDTQLSAVLTLTLCACSSGSSTSSITVAGSTTCLPIAEIAAEGFKEETGIDVLVSGLGSSAGIEAVSAGTADIASSSRGLNADEQDLGLTPIVIAHDGIAVIVNDDNPVDNLSTEQLRDIYAGKITNWKEVGGEDLRIQVINRDEASGTREAFRTIVMDGTPFDRRSAVLSGTGQVRDVVSRSRGAIGYISLGFVDSLNAKTSVKAVSVNHVEASEKTVASGGYPISRDLYFFVKGAPSQQAQDYIDYVTSEKMDKQIREAGFIPVTNDEKGSE